MITTRRPSNSTHIDRPIIQRASPRWRADMRPSGKASVYMPPRTDPFALHGDTAVIADAENVSTSSLKLGRAWDLQRTKGCLQPASGRLVMLCFYTAIIQGSRTGWADKLRALQIKPFVDQRIVRGDPNNTNSDFTIAFELGKYSSRWPVNTNIVLITGDGGLGSAMARCIARMKRKLYILSVPGTAAGYLQAGTNPFIKGFAWLGADVLRPAYECGGESDGGLYFGETGENGGVISSEE